MEYLKIKYRNSCDLGGSVFSAPNNAFYYKMFLKVDEHEGNYELREEGRENGDAKFVRDFAMLKRDYTYDLVVPEYTYDCLCHIQLHDTIFITNKLDENARAFDFKIGSPEKVKGGLRKIQLSFTVDYVVNSGCCQNEALTYQRCITCNSLLNIQGWIANNSPKFIDHPLSGALSTKDRDFWLVGRPVGSDLIENLLYWFDYITGTWILYQGRSEEAICWTESGINYKFYFDGHFWQPYQMMKSVANVSTNIVVKGYCLPDTWAQVQISTDGVNFSNTGQVTDGNIFSTLGISLSGLISATTYYFRFKLFNNNCNYGYSNILSIVKS